MKPEFINMTWEGPKTEARRRVFDYEAMALFCMERPGEWAKLPGQYRSVPKKEHLAPWNLDAVGRRVKNRPKNGPVWLHVYVRYVGDDNGTFS